MKLCIHCKHYRHSEHCVGAILFPFMDMIDAENITCDHPQFCSPVDGYSRVTAGKGRTRGMKCGPDADLFEEWPEEEKNKFYDDINKARIDSLNRQNEFKLQQQQPITEEKPKDLPIPGPCTNCGDKGHWRPDCPKLFPVKATRLPWWKRIFSK